MVFLLQRNIAGAENMGHRGPSERIDFDAGIGEQTQIASHRSVRIDSNSHENDICLQFGSIGQTNAVRCP